MKFFYTNFKKTDLGRPLALAFKLKLALALKLALKLRSQLECAWF